MDIKLDSIKKEKENFFKTFKGSMKREESGNMDASPIREQESPDIFGGNNTVSGGRKLVLSDISKERRDSQSAEPRPVKTPKLGGSPSGNSPTFNFDFENEKKIAGNEAIESI